MCVVRVHSRALWAQAEHRLDFSFSPSTPDFWALTLKPKKEEEEEEVKTQPIETKKENLPTVQFFVFCIDMRSNTLCLVF